MVGIRAKRAKDEDIAKKCTADESIWKRDEFRKFPRSSGFVLVKGWQKAPAGYQAG
uniref:Uncharacterized protein n=1 Tax=Knufia peltigerae TaxID=1002370 RepID=A0AA39CUW3_9EURO|nr:hypothetical protein H2204_009704 [Knufia peltigerae]